MRLLDRLFKPKPKPKPKPEPIEVGRFYINKHISPVKIHYMTVVLEEDDGWIVYCPYSRNEDKIFLDRKHVVMESQFRKDYARAETIWSITRNR